MAAAISKSTWEAALATHLGTCSECLEAFSGAGSPAAPCRMGERLALGADVVVPAGPVGAGLNPPP